MTAINPKDGEEYYTPMDFIDIKEVAAKSLAGVLVIIGFIVAIYSF